MNSSKSFLVSIDKKGIVLSKIILEGVSCVVIDTNIKDYNFPKVNQITVSIGAVEFKKGTFHVTTIDYADQALYHSKKSGRNTITFFEDMLMAGYAELLNVEDGEVDLF